MKSQKGITLISLTIYVIGMTLAISIITVISSYFYKNVDTKLTDINPLTEYTKFNGFFTDEINSDNIRFVDTDTEFKNNEIVKSFMIFYNNKQYVQYTFIKENRGIYRNKVKICSDVQSCKFEYRKEDTRDVVSVKIRMGNGKEKVAEYTLKN